MSVEESIKKIREIRAKENRFANEMGIEIVSMEEGYARGEMPVRDFIMNLNGAVHGGALATMADNIGGAAVSTMSGGYRVATLSSQMNYLAPAMKTEKLVAHGRVVKAGKRIIVAEVKIYDDQGTLVLIGLFEYSKLKMMY